MMLGDKEALWGGKNLHAKEVIWSAKILKRKFESKCSFKLMQKHNIVANK